MTYTNSSLVSYKALSPNYNARPTGSAITKIAIHYMAGDLTVEGCGSVFAPVSRQASSNYGIGSDGRVGMYVEEKNRAWTTGSPVCDNVAVTIEVANINAKGEITAKAMNTLIKLCADICKRNGIKKCTYTGDKSGTLQMHCWYQSTSCPGDYLKTKFGYIADEVNKILSGDTTTSTTATSTTTTSTTDKTSSTTSTTNITYKVRTKNSGWLPAVKNLEDYAGNGEPITSVAMKVGKGSIKYRVHVKGGSWLPYVTGYDTKEQINGYAGNGKTIDLIQAIYTAPSGKKWKVKYRVAGKGSYYDWQYNNEKVDGQDGYAGEKGVAITKFQAVIK